LAPLDHAAMIIGGAGTANERAAETVAVIRDQWRRVAEGGVTADELADTKTYLTGSFPLRFTSSDRIARILVAMQMEDLGIDYLDRRNGLIEAVTLDDVNRLAATLLDPDALTFVVAGQPDGIVATH
jgi:zinc protease